MNRSKTVRKSFSDKSLFLGHLNVKIPPINHILYMKHSLVDWRIYLYSIRASNVMKQDCWSSLTIAVVSCTECLLCCEPPETDFSA